MAKQHPVPADSANLRRFLPCLTALLLGAGILAGCNPTVKVEAPDKPIVINMNVKIEQEVRVKVDREVEDLLNKNPDLF